jgi:hypothetical protein
VIGSGLALALAFVFVGLPVIGFVIYQMFATIRDAPRPGTLGDNAASVDLASSNSPQRNGSTAQILPVAGIDPAFAWNVAVIVAGGIIGVIGLGAWLVADPTNSALRQAVAALWLIAGLLGLLISAVGVLGATIVNAISQSRTRD